MSNYIERAQQEFEKSFHEKDFYDRQTRDDKHLDVIFDMLDIKNGDKVLDFGTGSGYLSFAIAEKYENCSVVGIDIVSKTLEQNRLNVIEQGLDNLEFIDYDGITLPFENSAFDIVVARYVLHHVPDIQRTFDDIAKALTPNGSFLLSDPTPNDIDTDRFVDTYMQMKDDGHNKFYTFDEFSKYGDNAQLKQIKTCPTTICFPRKMDESYIDLLSKTSDALKRAYAIEITDDECFISEDVLNILFQKQ